MAAHPTLPGDRKRCDPSHRGRPWTHRQRITSEFPNQFRRLGIASPLKIVGKVIRIAFRNAQRSLPELVGNVQASALLNQVLNNAVRASVRRSLNGFKTRLRAQRHPHNVESDKRNSSANAPSIHTRLTRADDEA